MDKVMKHYHHRHHQHLLRIEQQDMNHVMGDKMRSPHHFDHSYRLYFLEVHHHQLQLYMYLLILDKLPQLMKFLQHFEHPVH